MTLDQIVAISDVAAVVLSSAAMIGCFYVRATAHAAVERRGATIEARIENAVKSLYDRINADHDRINKLEGKVDDMPRRDDVHSLSLQISNVSGDLKAMAAKMEALSESSRVSGSAIKRLENHLLKIEG